MYVKMVIAYVDSKGSCMESMIMSPKLLSSVKSLLQLDSVLSNEPAYLQ